METTEQRTTRFEDVLKKLNEQQRAAVTHGRSPLLIVAGAGTGKTTTLAHRVAFLIAEGVSPDRILLLTFTRRAANEMLSRVDELLAQSGSRASSRQVWGGTFHAVAARLLRKHGKQIGLRPDFTILDRGDSADLMQTIKSDLNLTSTEKRFPQKGTCVDIYSHCVNTGQKLRAVLSKHYPWALDHRDDLKRLFDAYMDRKEEAAVVDYDDLLLFWQALLDDALLGRELRERFECVLVDEYQDTNALQAGILERTCPDGEGLTVVGDDAQAIYSFRGATVRNILDFPADYPGTRIVPLEENYRSSSPILHATNQVIAEAREGHKKTLFTSRKGGAIPALVHCGDEEEEASYIVREILNRYDAGARFQDMAVLFRASQQSGTLETLLNRREIPFRKYGGLKFLETAHVKDVLAFLRFAENPRDEVSGRRVLSLLPGIGPKKAGSLMSLIQPSATEPFSLWRSSSLVPSSAKELWPRFATVMEYLSFSPQAKPRDVGTEIEAVRSFYEPIAESKYERVSIRMRDIEQLALIAGRSADRGSFLEEISLDPPTSTQDMEARESHTDDDYLVLSTIHSAKGLEWDCVFVLQCCDGSLPNTRAIKGEEGDIEEERRLFYVALTRPRHELFAMHPQRLYAQRRGMNYHLAPLTRFLTPRAVSAFDGMTPEDDVRSDVTVALDARTIRSRVRSRL